MNTPMQEFPFYTQFQEVAQDILNMANQILRDKFLYITSIGEEKQVILKILDNDLDIGIHEGMKIELHGTLCNRIDFTCDKPLFFEDISKESCLNELMPAIQAANVNAYLGVPILLRNGDIFGTLCAVNSVATVFDSASILLFQKIAKLFSYYLDLEKLAYSDALTGIYNRQFLFKYFEEHEPTQGLIFYLDLDGFKAINDVHGHHIGDLVLKETALRLEKLITQWDAFAVRLGGDEFILHVNHLADVQDITALAESVLEQLSSWDTYTEQFQLSASIGIVGYDTSNYTSLPVLLEHADTALYRAKASGKNTYHFFEG
ncbi:diguanylate cyclase domain-containing protein [Paenibacillus massiliensis]|uniref:sensor domain-containing diguanylate cyclase n=1 Tax=Paenibacillus massiliensis TaxID=225917 RepID=UPI00046EA424|nr:diguanylate cyclase [Paenibacillus massiliensis]